MPKYDYQFSSGGPARIAKDCSLEALKMHVTSDLEYNMGDTVTTITITKKRGKAKPGN